MNLFRLAALAFAAVGLTQAAHAADPRHPDWPCQQIMVPTLSVAAFWTDPPLDNVGDAWRKDPAVADLVERLAARRTAMEEAEKSIKDFVTGSAEEKQWKATTLFAGLFATLNEERTQVMQGIERFARRQQELRDKIRDEVGKMRRDQDQPDADKGGESKLGEAIAWDTRVYDERRHTIGYVCDVPTTIERRRFSLARAIQQTLQ